LTEPEYFRRLHGTLDSHFRTAEIPKTVLEQVQTTIELRLRPYQTAGPQDLTRACPLVRRADRGHRYPGGDPRLASENHHR
jgi:hypothetical protein